MERKVKCCLLTVTKGKIEETGEIEIAEDIEDKKLKENQNVPYKEYSSVLQKTLL